MVERLDDRGHGLGVVPPPFIAPVERRQLAMPLRLGRERAREECSGGRRRGTGRTRQRRCRGSGASAAPRCGGSGRTPRARPARAGTSEDPRRAQRSCRHAATGARYEASAIHRCVAARARHGRQRSASCSRARRRPRSVAGNASRFRRAGARGTARSRSRTGPTFRVPAAPGRALEQWADRRVA
jgi:hypothetical protein